MVSHFVTLITLLPTPRPVHSSVQPSTKCLTDYPLTLGPSRHCSHDRCAHISTNFPSLSETSIQTSQTPPRMASPSVCSRHPHPVSARPSQGVRFGLRVRIHQLVNDVIHHALQVLPVTTEIQYSMPLNRYSSSPSPPNMIPTPWPSTSTKSRSTWNTAHMSCRRSKPRKKTNSTLSGCCQQ